MEAAEENCDGVGGGVGGQVRTRCPLIELDITVPAVILTIVYIIYYIYCICVLRISYIN